MQSMYFLDENFREINYHEMITILQTSGSDGAPHTGTARGAPMRGPPLNRHIMRGAPRPLNMKLIKTPYGGPKQPGPPP